MMLRAELPVQRNNTLKARSACTDVNLFLPGNESMTVVGSGIVGERLAAGSTAIVLLTNTIATGAALVALISPSVLCPAPLRSRGLVADASEGVRLAGS